MSATSLNPWAFDVTSLMVLIGDQEEGRLRSSRSSWIEVLIAAPVAGIQNYLKSYDAISTVAQREYFSPFGCNKAPLRNAKLDSTIKNLRLLDEGKYFVYTIKDDAGKKVHRHIYLHSLWLTLTWCWFGGLVAFWYNAPFGDLPPGTWKGITNISVLTGWSIIVRTIELVMVEALEKANEPDSNSKDATTPGGIFFLGKRNSGLVILGTRQAIKLWTSSRLEYDEGTTYSILNRHVQIFIRIGTILVLLLVFVTVPNGSTTDQLVFILLNILGQANVFLGIRLNARSCKGQLDEQTALNDKKGVVKYRTQVYGYLIREFDGKDADPGWIDKSEMLPKTNVWEEFQTAVIKDKVTDPKVIYDALVLASGA
ncbi:hypothetical protein BP5796_07631 [Coleophoma crateriformis]|uniref:Uncharacterized protein n=1 Tax=Coleophoma crateriformis TaxID=565419 RepID=A0A3D8RJG8_9HELO|nr:hypothetical protein BP5796_07631 [Coleophoma crateriformis]